MITGAGSGMGRSMAGRFAAEGGALVAAADWHRAQLDETVAEVAAAGTITGVRGDVSDRAQAEAIVATTLQRHGRLDVLVNNAGVMDLDQGAAEMDDAIWERVLGINRNGPMYLTRVAIPRTLQPVEIADLALFLGSDEASRVNGSVIPADGGGVARRPSAVSRSPPSRAP